MVDIADLPDGTISATTLLEVQNGSDGQKITGQDILDYVEANLPSGIASIQRGDFNANATAGVAPQRGYIDITISSVDTTKCAINVLGSASAAVPTLASYSSVPPSLGSTYTAGQIYGTLTSATNLRVYFTNTSLSATATMIGHWEVVEYN